MHPYFHLFGREIPAYGIMMLLGISAGAGVIALLCGRKENGIPRSDALLAGCIALAGAFGGGLLLRPLMKLPGVVLDWERYGRVPAGDLLGYLFGEIVFYGGLIGGALAAVWFCRKFSIPFLPVADLFAAAIPAGHAFGRVGCLLGGCCYGREVHAGHPFGVLYPERTDGLDALAAPANTPLLAVPLIEAACLLVIAALAAWVYLKSRANGLSAGVYCALYATARFVLEFFRGDMIRGQYGGITTSQYISFVVFLAGLFLLWTAFRRRPARKRIS